MSPFDRGDRILFEQVAELYDQARPGYPRALLDSLIDLAGLHPGDRLLEIGCGTGQLTRPLAQYGFDITAVELGARLAARARLNLRAYSHVSVLTGSFEDWANDQGGFDGVVSAQVFHWIDPSIGYPKALEALKPRGHLALIWNLFPGGRGPIYDALDAAYRTCAPQLCGDDPEASLAARVERTVREIRDSGLFTEPRIVQHPWASIYDTAGYIRLLQTFSDHRALSAATRDALFAAVSQVIDHFGGTIERPWIATLFLSRPLR